MNPWHREFAPSPLPPSRRVVITGLGAVSAAGVGVLPLWQALLAGQSCISTIETFDADGLHSQIAGEVKDFDPAWHIEPRLKPRRMTRQAQFAVAATSQAVCDAGLTHPAMLARRCGVVLGSSGNNVGEIAEAAVLVETSGPQTLGPAAMGVFNMQNQALAIVELLRLPEAACHSLAGSCAAGLDAIVMGAEMIRTGQAEIVVCGGTDSPMSRTAGSALVQAGVCSTRNGEPERASRPFDRERDNGLMGEGAGMVVLERRDLVLERGGTYYAEWLGSGTSRDVKEARVGNGLQRAMRGALHNAGCPPDKVDYISAWGCGDPVIDAAETRAIKEVFGARAYGIGVSSMKAVIGNPLAAAGALQLVSSALSLRYHVLPPTANYEHRDPECDLDYIPEGPRRCRPRYVLVNTHGNGGGNTCVVLGPATA